MHGYCYSKTVRTTSKSRIGLCLVFVGLAACTKHSSPLPPQPGTPSLAEMADCATATSYDRPVVESYWSAGTFQRPPSFGEKALSDEFTREWYTTQLCAMGEAPLTAPAAGSVRIRFIWVRTFHPAISVRVEHSAHETQLFAVELDGKGGYEPGTAARRIRRSLSLEEWTSLQESISNSGFWGLPTKPPSGLLGFDGAQWIVEVATQDRYHVVDRWRGADLQPIGRYLLELSDLNPAEIY